MFRHAIDDDFDAADDADADADDDFRLFRWLFFLSSRRARCFFSISRFSGFGRGRTDLRLC